MKLLNNLIILLHIYASYPKHILTGNFVELLTSSTTWSAITQHVHVIRRLAERSCVFFSFSRHEKFMSFSRVRYEYLCLNNLSNLKVSYHYWCPSLSVLGSWHSNSTQHRMISLSGENLGKPRCLTCVT